jgi:type I restriction enzyme, S subunit
LKTLDFHAYSDKAAVPGVNRNHLHEAVVSIPPVAAQREIAAFLGALDDRITLLRETNAILEAIAQALFKSWFVDFDPVRAKMEGRAPEGMDEATAALFPDSFEETELGLVPRGWKTVRVADVAEVVKGRSYSSKDLVETHHTALVTLKSFERGGGFRMDGFKPYSGAYKPTQIVRAGDLILAYTDVTQAAELIGKPAIVVGVDEFQTLVASLDVGIIRPNEVDCGKQFLYGLFRTDAFQAHTLAHTSGTTVLHLAKDGVGSYVFPLPTVQLVHAFEEIASAIGERKQTNSDAIRTLATLRDTLLPRLISGQLRLPEAVAELKALA